MRLFASQNGKKKLYYNNNLFPTIQMCLSLGTAGGRG
uniref:Uncharacterized protein n=1 Tax=Anguilla anguilla TaxID=7936 RepID=A0A0E9QJP4_ANGAN